MKIQNCENWSRRKCGGLWVAITLITGGAAFLLYVDKELAATLGFSLYCGATVVSLILTLKYILPEKAVDACRKILRAKPQD